MNTTFYITGGAGRVISAIPALEKFHKLNPNNDFRVLVAGWEFLLWGHPLLQDRTFSIDQKNVFEDHVKNNFLVEPEPYHLHSFYNQKTSLAEAFDEIINNTQDHADLSKPNLYPSTHELTLAHKNYFDMFNSANENAKVKKEKLVVIQPYGSSMLNLHPVKPVDPTSRSLDPDSYYDLISNLDEKILIVYFGVPELKHPLDTISYTLNDHNLRSFMSLISISDYFIGCDSVGQHMARAFNKPGSVFMGSTFEANVSYPNYFKFYRNNKITPKYLPMRISTVDSNFAERSNDGIMTFSKEEIVKIAKEINKKVLGK